jgi:hypothetical protein
MSGIYTLKPRSSQKEITRYFLTSISPAALVAQRPAALVAQRPAALVAQRPAALVAQRPAALVELTNFLKQTKRERGQNEFKSFQLFPLLRWRAPRSRGLEAHVAAILAWKLKSDDAH